MEKPLPRKIFEVIREAYGTTDDEVHPEVYESMVCETTRNNLVLTWIAGCKEHERDISEIMVSMTADDGTSSIGAVKEELLNRRNDLLEHNDDPLCYALSYRKVEYGEMMGVMTPLQIVELFHSVRYLAEGKLVSAWIDILADTSEAVSQGRWSRVGLKPYAEMPVICLADIEGMRGRDLDEFRGMEQSLWMKMECQIAMLYKGLYKNNHLPQSKLGINVISDTSRHSKAYTISENFIRKDAQPRIVALDDLEEMVVLHIASSRVSHKVSWLGNVLAVVNDFSSSRGLKDLKLKATEVRTREADGFCRYRVALAVGPREYAILVKECMRQGRVLSRPNREDFDSYPSVSEQGYEPSFKIYRTLLPGVVCAEGAEEDSQGLRLASREGDVVEFRGRKIIMSRGDSVFMLWKLNLFCDIDGTETEGPSINLWTKAVRQSNGTLRFEGGGVVQMKEESWRRIENGKPLGPEMALFVRETAGAWMDVLNTSWLFDEEDFNRDLLVEATEWKID